MENKINYAEIDEWGRSFETRSYAYKKIHPTYNILTLKITAKSGKRLVLCNPKKPYNEWDLGLFDGYNSKKLFEDFFMRMVDHSGLIYLNNLDDYGFPVEEWYCKNKKEFDPLERKIDQRLDKELEEFEKEIAQEEAKKAKEAEKESNDKNKDDHTYIDYNSFVFAKNGYIREKVNSFLFKYKVGVIALYTIIAIIISTSFFKSQYFLEASFIMRLFWIFVFIGVSVWLGKLADKKLSEMFDKFKKEEDDSFSLTDEVVYNKVLDKMVNNEVDYFSHNTKRTLTRLLEKQSPDIPQEVYELKRSCDVSSATFVDAISTANRKALLKEILEKQANFAREKSINLLDKIKEGGSEALAKEAITPLGRVDAAVRDILQKNNLVEEKEK